MWLCVALRGVARIQECKRKAGYLALTEEERASEAALLASGLRRGASAGEAPAGSGLGGAEGGGGGEGSSLRQGELGGGGGAPASADRTTSQGQRNNTSQGSYSMVRAHRVMRPRVVGNASVARLHEDVRPCAWPQVILGEANSKPLPAGMRTVPALQQSSLHRTDIT